jgi:hypothetical protein
MPQDSIKQNQSRDQLKEYFSNGKIPNQVHYAELINSMVHKTEDGFSKDKDNGLKLYNLKTYKSMVSFYSDVNDLDPFYQITKDDINPSSLKFQPFTEKAQSDKDDRGIYFHVNGNLGVGKLPDPNYKMDINGFAGMQGRIGTYLTGLIPADGRWHNIIEGLDNCHVYEIVARAGKKGSGKFSIMHAVAVSAYGRSGGKIRKTCGCFGFFWNKLNLRWKGTTHNYTLQMKTNINYGRDVNAHFSVTKLWDDELFSNDNEFYK